MTKKISLEEWLEDFVASTGLAMWKYRRFLIRKRRFRPDYATTKALDYGLRMLESGVGSAEDISRAEDLFRQISAAYISMADLCSDVIGVTSPS